MTTAYLLIGGNMGNRSAYLEQAIELIKQSCGEIIRQSSIYETAAWGLKDQPPFYNQALVLETTLEPVILMEQLLGIEETMGRKRTVKLGPRIIDLDILLIDDLVIKADTLSLPHPALPQRRFALMPLSEVAPDLLHPVLQKTIQQLLEECTDEGNVQKK